MIEPKISLNLLVPGAGMLSSQDCEKSPKESYNEFKLDIKETKGKGKSKKEVKKTIIVKTRKQKTISHHINMCKDAYDFMLQTPPTPKLIKGWNRMRLHEKLKSHFDLIAQDFNAVSYSYEILED